MIKIFLLEVIIMPRTKKTAAPEVKDVKVAEEVKKPVADVAAEKPAKKTAAKKPAAKKTAAKPAATPKQTVKIQFGGDEYDITDIQKTVEADIKGKFKGKIKTVEAYIKLEDKAVYYVVNSDFSDKVAL